MNTSQTTATALNTLLADYHMYYQKLRNFHWNITGRNFFELHTKFEELYEVAKLKIDEIAERILTLGTKPISNYTDYLRLASVQEAPTHLKDHEMVSAIITDHQLILKQLKSVTKAAENANDDGTLDILGAYIGELEKINWMLNAWNTK